MTKRVRVDPFDADFAIFASLGRDFDAQYLKIDSIFASAGLTDFDDRKRRELVPRRGENGIYFLESVYSKIIPRDLHEHDERIWKVFSNEQLYSHHGLYEVRSSVVLLCWLTCLGSIFLACSLITFYGSLVFFVRFETGQTIRCLGKSLTRFSYHTTRRRLRSFVAPRSRDISKRIALSSCGTLSSKSPAQCPCSCGSEAGDSYEDHKSSLRIILAVRLHSSSRAFASRPSSAPRIRNRTSPPAR